MELSHSPASRLLPAAYYRMRPVPGTAAAVVAVAADVVVVGGVGVDAGVAGSVAAGADAAAAVAGGMGDGESP